MPRLKDQFQTFLRELRVEDLNGSAGILPAAAGAAQAVQHGDGAGEDSTRC